MSIFPGRTLEEIDGIDVCRLTRAMEAQRILRIEARQALYLAQRIDARAIAPEEWQQIRHHEMLVQQFGEPPETE